MMLRFHTQTAGVQLTAQQPEVNLVRVAVQALGAVLGGTQSLHTNSYDEAIALPTVKAATLAVRTQQVLAYETDVTSTVDPFAGSYAVESMTDAIERQVMDLMKMIDDRGGAVAAIEQGFQKGEIEQSAYKVACQIEDGSRTVVGVNQFRSDSEERYEPLRVNPLIEAEQRERLRRLRAERDNAVRRSGAQGPAGCGRGFGQRLVPDEGRAAFAGDGRGGLSRPARRLGRLRPARRVLTDESCQGHRAPGPTGSGRPKGGTSASAARERTRGNPAGFLGRGHAHCLGRAGEGHDREHEVASGAPDAAHAVCGPPAERVIQPFLRAACSPARRRPRPPSAVSGWT